MNELELLNGTEEIIPENIIKYVSAKEWRKKCI